MRTILSIVATSALAACYGGSAPLSSGSGGVGASTTVTLSATSSPLSSDASGVNPSAGSWGGESTGGLIEPPSIHWVGRYQDPDPMTRAMGWSGAGLVVRFDGTELRVTMDDLARYFSVVIDGEVQPPLSTSPGVIEYIVASDLAPGEHTVELYRRTEGNLGPTIIHSVTIDGELLSPSAVARRMEVIGDSISAGYGNEGRAPCRFSPATENHYLTYGAIAARAVGAEVHTVAWSGKGLVFNYGDDVIEPLPDLYDRAVATDGTPWDFSWLPDVVVVNLGTNDFSTDNDPSEEQFVGSYVAFLEHLRDVYPDTFILLLAPSLFGAEARVVEGYLMEVVEERNVAGDLELAVADINIEWIGSGCDFHPNVITHEGMAERLIEALQVNLGW